MSRILLVDDDASLLKLMSMRLRSQGYEVDTADSAEGALDRLRQQRADLVLSDLRMGGMDGLALFERIQSQWLGMPVIIMTAHGTIPDAIQATRSGVFSFLTKPIDKDELLVTIEHALSLTRPKQQQEWQSLIQTRNPQMEQLLIQASSIATMDVPVLILGPSGAGKSTLINRLIPGAAAQTGEISQALNSGKHTTTTTTWYWLDHEKTSALIDSPGFQEFGLRHIDPMQLAAYMPDIKPHVAECKFYNCTHLHEPGCGVISNVESTVGAGGISASRYKIYTDLFGELRAAPQR